MCSEAVRWHEDRARARSTSVVEQRPEPPEERGRVRRSVSKPPQRALGLDHARRGIHARAAEVGQGMTTSTLDKIATASGTFSLGGDLDVVRLGFGAMRITGPGIWGPPADPDEALRVLRRIPEL